MKQLVTLQVKHLRSHLIQVGLIISFIYCPSGQLLSQILASRFLKKPYTQLEQLEFEGPLQEEQY